MKIIVSVKNVSITIDSEFNNPQIVKGIEQVLEALCWVIRGTDLSGQWPRFDKLVMENAKSLKANIE